VYFSPAAKKKSHSSLYVKILRRQSKVRVQAYPYGSVNLYETDCRAVSRLSLRPL